MRNLWACRHKNAWSLGIFSSFARFRPCRRFKLPCGSNGRPSLTAIPQPASPLRVAVGKGQGHAALLFVVHCAHAWHALTSITEEEVSKEQRREEKRRKQSKKLTQFQRTTYSQGRSKHERGRERGVCERTPWITRQRPNPIEPAQTGDPHHATIHGRWPSSSARPDLLRSSLRTTTLPDSW